MPILREREREREREETKERRERAGDKKGKRKSSWNREKCALARGENISFAANPLHGCSSSSGAFIFGP
jgi:hypothetical protein